MAIWSFFKAVLASLFVVIYADVGVAKELAPRDGDISESWSPLLSPEALQTFSDQLPDLQIVDIRSQKRASKGVVPGSVLMPYKEWRGPKDRPGQPPTEQQLEEYLADAGLRLDLPIAIVNHSGSTLQSGQASYIYWLLKTAGVQDVAILNGGFKAWAKSGQEIADEPSVLEPSFVNVDYKYDWWADPMDIFGVSSGQTHGFILDARLDAQTKRAEETGKPMMSMPMAQLLSANLFTNYLSNRDLSAEGLDCLLYTSDAADE